MLYFKWCVCVCVRACVRACVCVHAHGCYLGLSQCGMCVWYMCKYNSLTWWIPHVVRTAAARPFPAVLNVGSTAVLGSCPISPPQCHLVLSCVHTRAHTHTNARSARARTHTHAHTHTHTHIHRGISGRVEVTVSDLSRSNPTQINRSKSNRCPNLTPSLTNSCHFFPPLVAAKINEYINT